MVKIKQNMADGRIELSGKPFDVCFECFLIALKATHTLTDISESKEFNDLMIAIIARYLENPKQDIGDFLDEINPILDRMNETLGIEGSGDE